MKRHENANEVPEERDGDGPDEELPNPDVVCVKGAARHCRTCNKFFPTKYDLNSHIQRSEIRFLKVIVTCWFYWVILMPFFFCS